MSTDERINRTTDVTVVVTPTRAADLQPGMIIVRRDNGIGLARVASVVPASTPGRTVVGLWQGSVEEEKLTYYNDYTFVVVLI